MFFSRGGVKCTITEKNTFRTSKPQIFPFSRKKEQYGFIFILYGGKLYSGLHCINTCNIDSFLAFLLYFKQAVERHIPLRISAHEIPYKTARKVIFLYKRALCGIASRILKPDDVRS